MLSKYTKADLKKIVSLYNISLDEKSLKKKKADLIKDMEMEKKDFDEKEIDKKLKKKETNTSEPKGTHKMPDGTVMSGKTHSKDSKPVKKKRKLIIKKKPVDEKKPVQKKKQIIYPNKKKK